MSQTSSESDGNQGDSIHTGKTLADLILAYLSSIKAEYIFGVPGGAIEPLYNALARSAREPEEDGHLTVKSVVARHEAGAAFMADGYARETGQLGVCCGTTGPGTTNLITGVASAYADRIPMLVITAQTALPNFGKRGLQESSSDGIDTVAMFENFTNYNTMISHPSQLEGKLFTALISAFHEPQGPVHISIPMDVLSCSWDGNSTFKLCNLLRNPEIMDDESMDALCETLIDAKKIVLFLGGGSAEAMPAIMKFAEMAGVPFVTTASGKGCVDAYHPLNQGVFGFAGHDTARDTLLDPEVDIVLAVGTSLGEISTGGWDKDALMNNKLIHIEETAENFARSPMARLHVYGHLHTVFINLIQIFATLIHRLETVKPQEIHNIIRGLNGDNIITCAPAHIKVDKPEAYLLNDTPIKPQRLMGELVKGFPENTRFVVDAGNSWAWATHYLHPKQAGNYRIALGFGAMAWAVGASVGTAFGAPDEPVVCITGDGSFLMSGQELTVTVQHSLPVIYVVLNDNTLGMVKHGQKLGGGEPIGFDLPVVNYAAVAQAMGAQAFTIKTPEDFSNLDFNAICNSNGPTLLDVYIDGEEVPPMGSRMKVLDRRNGSRRGDDSIED
ncbi:MAG: acetolactate synthase [endosymbiont of Galathealinum brachiosum]|uniref:Acetolactate synthase n=1 Tax=endosymbiont of Galathealinum brachiosum TaxID=2200906 RepID=A0A370DLH1_9GAMM|nr:MAG: acetolactate synthase [endosymbiont of Galathealinum brachiosum]